MFIYDTTVIDDLYDELDDMADELEYNGLDGMLDENGEMDTMEDSSAKPPQ